MNAPHLMSRRLLAATVLATTLLAACAGLHSVTSEVSTFGEWPTGRTPGSFAFERLPSQAARAAEADALEATALPALVKAGFKPAAAGQQPDVLVQVAATASRSDGPAWNDPLWWRGGFGYHRHGPWTGPAWGGGVGLRFEQVRYERGIALLVRERATGKPLFEARASNEGSAGPDTATLQAMFEASMMDFPKTGVNPRRVTVQTP
jgi:Domain of unknown function (DUF4136)